jgi:quercetin dioxygenase-like cupin family protein
MPERAGAREIAYRFESLDYGATERRFNAYYAEFLPQAKERARPHSHAGVEFLYVLEGALQLHIGDQEEKLDAGDAIYFDSQVPHAYRRAGTRTCSAIVITAT